MIENKNIDELLRDKLQNFEQEPPGFVLQNILNGTATKTKRRKVFFWRVSAVAAVLLISFVAGWQYVSRDAQVSTQESLSAQSIPEESGHEKTIQDETTNLYASENRIDSPAASHQVFSGKRVSLKNKLDSNTSSIASSDESMSLEPIKSRSSLIQTNTNSATKLHTRKASEKDVKSIDQQIMEQNQQMMMVQNSVKEKGRWLLGAQVAPVHNVSKGSQSAQYASNMLTAESSNTVDLGGGLTVEYKPGKRWSIQSGVYYGGMEHSSGNSAYQSGSKNSISADLGSDYLTTKVNVDTKTNKISMNSPAGVIQFNTVPSYLVIGNSIESKDMASAVFVSDAQFTQNFEYVEIPLYLRYTLLDTKFDIEIIGGLSSNILVGNQAYVETNSGKTLVGETSDMEQMNYSGTLGMGFKYGLSKRFFLNLEPRVKYYLNSLNSNESVNYKPYTVGVFTGISYQF